MWAAILIFIVTWGLLKKGRLNNGGKNVKRIILFLELAGVLVAAKDYLKNRVLFDGQITRNNYGEDSIREELTVYSGKNKEKISLEIPSRHLTDEEKLKNIAEAKKEIDKTVCGGNKDLSSIKENLDVRDSYNNGTVSAEWSFSNEDLVGHDGCVKNGLLKKEELVGARVRLNCDEMEEEYSFHLKIQPVDIDTKSGFKKALEAEMAEYEKKNEKDEEYTLPKKVGNQKVRWEKAIDRRGVLICVMGMLVVLLWPIQERQKKRSDLQKRQRKLEADYPGILRKLSLYVESGMSVKKAFSLIGQEYSKRKISGETGERPGYELILNTVRQIESGTSEIQSYSDMGSKEKIFRKLSVILTQNIRRGSVDLKEKLGQEAFEADNRERQRIRLQGEKISTKMMIPLMGMLGIIMIVLIVPAMWSISI